jgi:hypothetical protein
VVSQSSRAERCCPKGWMRVVTPGAGVRGQRQLVATAEAGGKLPVECPAWHDRAVVVPIVPVAADSVTPLRPRSA